MATSIHQITKAEFEELADPEGGYLEMELPYLSLPEHELWRADVAFITHSQLTAWDADKRQTCLAPWLSGILASREDRADLHSRQAVPLNIMGAAPLPVRNIFEQD